MVTRILYIGGSGRSGSTLVDRLVGQLPGFVSTGELRVISHAGLGQNRLCGCGEPFDSCPFWTAVGDRAFGGWRQTQRAALDEAASVSYFQTLGELLNVRRPDHRHRNIALLRSLYETISELAGGATIVDSSKGPRYAALLSTIPGLQVSGIHLVRDPRGVAYSWSKRVTRPDMPGRSVEMLRMGAGQVAGRWIAHNVMMELLGRRIPMARLGYEALLADPRAEITRILETLSMPVQPASLSYIGRGSVHLEPNHTVMGNPMRLQVGEIPLRLDDAWQASIPAGARARVTAITWPLLLRYGYPLRASSGPTEARPAS